MTSRNTLPCSAASANIATLQKEMIAGFPGLSNIQGFSQLALYSAHGQMILPSTLGDSTFYRALSPEPKSSLKMSGKHIIRANTKEARHLEAIGHANESCAAGLLCRVQDRETTSTSSTYQRLLTYLARSLGMAFCQRALHSSLACPDSAAAAWKRSGTLLYWQAFVMQASLPAMLWVCASYVMLLGCRLGAW